jgi:hypothetical protein
MNESALYYCKEFIETEENPQFSIFIKGEWGCGKTYFIRKIIDSYPELGDGLLKGDISYISLFGVTSTLDIDNKIFQALHPLLSSKGMQIAGTVLRTALRLGLNIDFNDDQKKDVTVTLGGLPKIPRDIKIQKKLLVVDDFERAFIEPSQIFGYFSEMINQSNCKVIFIGNEDQIGDQDENIRKKFTKIKEKTVGIEFKLEPDIDSAMDSFLQEIGFSSDMNEELKTICTEVNKVLECENLRTIRQSLFNLKILIDSIDEAVNDDHKVDIIKIFIALYVQKSTGEITDISSIKEAIVAFVKYQLSYKKYCEKKEKESKNNWFYGYLDKYVPLSNCWEEIIFNGVYSKKYLIAEYKKENEFNKETPKNLFLLLNNWHNLDKDRFQKLVSETKKELSDGVYLHPGEILHYFNIMGIFAAYGLIPDTIAEIIEETKSTISTYQDKIVPIDNWIMLNESYGGWGYSKDIAEISEIKNLLEKESKNNAEIEARKQIEKEIENENFNVIEFCKNIRHDTGNNKYYGKPILKMLDLDKFYNLMNNLQIEDQKMIISSLEERYGKKYTNGNILEEYKNDLPNLILLRNKYLAENAPILYDPIAFQKKNIAKELSDLVVYFEQKGDKGVGDKGVTH